MFSSMAPMGSSFLGAASMERERFMRCYICRKGCVGIRRVHVEWARPGASHGGKALGCIAGSGYAFRESGTVRGRVSMRVAVASPNRWWHTVHRDL